jgi:hypothetical protein
MDEARKGLIGKVQMPYTSKKRGIKYEQREGYANPMPAEQEPEESPEGPEGSIPTVPEAGDLLQPIPNMTKRKPPRK